MPSPSSSQSKGLTDYLMTRDPEGFKKATQTPFLERAGKGTLDKRVLQQWLSQDRLYAQAYVRFASLLLANIRLPAAVDPEDVNEKYIPSLIHTSHPLLPSTSKSPFHQKQSHSVTKFSPRC
jgi:TENA/THI-4/PQQC family